MTPLLYKFSDHWSESEILFLIMTMNQTPGLISFQLNLKSPLWDTSDR